jgi:hypothetical protein
MLLLSPYFRVRAGMDIWLEISHHAAFRVGGWAWVRADGASLTGQAGGERGVDAERTALAGLAAALRDLKGPIRLHSSSDLVAALAPPQLEVIRTAPEAGTPTAFAAAWAELARDKAKSRGAFAAPIPKSNLAKAGV